MLEWRTLKTIGSFPLLAISDAPMVTTALNTALTSLSLSSSLLSYGDSAKNKLLLKLFVVQTLPEDDEDGLYMMA